MNFITIVLQLVLYILAGTIYTHVIPNCYILFFFYTGQDFWYSDPFLGGLFCHGAVRILDSYLDSDQHLHLFLSCILNYSHALYRIIQVKL